MTLPFGERVWVFHSGALGDHVMIWPFVRALASQGTAITVVAPSSHARLCEQEIRPQIAGSTGIVRGIGVEQPRFTRMWSGGACPSECIEVGIDTVVSFVADETSASGRTWIDAARAMFPASMVVCVGPPRSAAREAIWSRSEVAKFGAVALSSATVGSVTFFTGAGGESKRWPLEGWLALAAAIRARSPSTDVRLLSGPVEAEKWSDDERAGFADAGGAIIGRDGDLAPLADAIRSSRVFVGCDTGPAHLAAQLGVPTIALFGPTDPCVWAPVGPRVHVLSPESPRGMDWLAMERVLGEIQTTLSEASRVTSAG